jgi:hypothetical protein
LNGQGRPEDDGHDGTFAARVIVAARAEGSPFASYAFS